MVSPSPPLTFLEQDWGSIGLVTTAELSRCVRRTQEPGQMTSATFSKRCQEACCMIDIHPLFIIPGEFSS